jgi:uncharacterized membrane protein
MVGGEKQMRVQKIFQFMLLALITLGLADAAYLTWEHYANIVPPCQVGTILGRYIDCGQVLQSRYATVFGIPLALFGFGYYLLVGAILLLRRRWLLIITLAGLSASVYFFYLQYFVIGAICLYCTFSGVINLLLFAAAATSIKLEE